MVQHYVHSHRPRANVQTARGSRGNKFLFKTQALDSAHEIYSVKAIAVPEQIARWGAKRKGFDHLLGCPSGRGRLGDLEMKDFTAFVGQEIFPACAPLPKQHNHCRVIPCP